MGASKIEEYCEHCGRRLVKKKPGRFIPATRDRRRYDAETGHKIKPVRFVCPERSGLKRWHDELWYWQDQSTGEFFPFLFDW